jgi:hypothetical protein
LALLGIVLRGYSQHRSGQLLAGEDHGRTTVRALYEASVAFTGQGKPHPGLADLVDAVPGLESLDEASAGEQAYAWDERYVYGLTTTATGTARPTYGFILRAWPREFGVTGDHEYYIRDDGQLWEGVNERGRSGLRQGFPPPFPDPAVGNRRNAWYAWPQR